ncbi:DNA-binding protein Alba [archaeon CG_4_8_14_3_um_filter_38_5]|nr:MAG: DNA-binding protein Alba [archaeon CG07_land_8_20_14_0_80_38_8]PIU89286.1 MAG: DNA-binding protein Alba [archaeon CG06_land_8_20_14_3_00_37_11]PIX43864.1 MAG: DNA-binding protein Alba [archaeon CG_4_8_14_3_um_filter_38_5]
MKYVLGVVTQFQNGSEEVFVKARGRLISKAVDVVEILRNKLMKEVNVNNIETSTQKITGDKGDVNVSVISIRLLK